MNKEDTHKSKSVSRLKIWINRSKRWIKTHPRKSLLILFVALTILVVGGVVVASITAEPTNPAPVAKKPIKPKPAPVFHSPLTGMVVPDEVSTKLATTAIMIENSPDARPQSGIKNSGIVYEAIAEGGITRFLAIYQEHKPGLVGPVRSLRPYYVDWLAPYDASVVHVGGSKTALDEVRNGTYRDIDQFFNASTYWRAGDRYAPHNVYTNFKRIDELNKSKGYNESSFTGFKRKDDNPADTPSASSISVTMSSPTYNSSYTYNKNSNRYLRHQGGAIHKDREDGDITPRVVIVMKSTMRHVMEDGYRESIQTTGTGEAHIFQDGKVEKGTWSKAGRKDRLSFLDSEGLEIELNRGQTWITVIPSDRNVTWQ